MTSKYKIGDVLNASTTFIADVCCGPTPHTGVAKATGNHAFKNGKVVDIYFNSKENNYWYSFDVRGNYYEEKGLELVKSAEEPVLNYQIY